MMSNCANCADCATHSCRTVAALGEVCKCANCAPSKEGAHSCTFTHSLFSDVVAGQRAANNRTGTFV